MTTKEFKYGLAGVQGDVRFAEVMKLMGVKVEYEPNAIILTGPELPLKNFDHNCNDIPDAAMTAAVAALLADGCANLLKHLQCALQVP